MNRWMMKALVAGCLVAAGCGGGDRPGTQGLKQSAAQGNGGDSDPGSGGGSGGDTGSGPGATADRADDIRLLGVNAGDLESFLFRVKAVEVRANGMVLANTLMTSQMDLTTATNAFLLTSFKAPAGVEEVEVIVALDSATAVLPANSLDIDMSCQMLRLKAKVKLVEQHHHAVIVLDLARSLGKVGAGMGFAPHLQLVY